MAAETDAMAAGLTHGGSGGAPLLGGGASELPPPVGLLMKNLSEELRARLPPVAALVALHVAGGPLQPKAFRRKGKAVKSKSSWAMAATRAARWIQGMTGGQFALFVRRAMERAPGSELSRSALNGRPDDWVEKELAKKRREAALPLEGLKDGVVLADDDAARVQLHRMAMPARAAGEFGAKRNTGIDHTVVQGGEMVPARCGCEEGDDRAFGVSVNAMNVEESKDSDVYSAHMLLFTSRFGPTLRDALSCSDDSDDGLSLPANATYKQCVDLLRERDNAYLSAFPGCFVRDGAPSVVNARGEKQRVRVVVDRSREFDKDGFVHMLLQNAEPVQRTELGRVAMCMADKWKPCPYVFKLEGSAEVLVTADDFPPPPHADPIVREAWNVLATLLEALPRGALASDPATAFDAALFVVAISRGAEQRFLPLHGPLLRAVRAGLDLGCGRDDLRDWRLREHVREREAAADEVLGMDYLVYGNLDVTNFKADAARFDSNGRLVRAKASPSGLVPGGGVYGGGNPGKMVDDGEDAQGVFTVEAGKARVEVPSECIEGQEKWQLPPHLPLGVLPALLRCENLDERVRVMLEKATDPDIDAVVDYVTNRMGNVPCDAHGSAGAIEFATLIERANDDMPLVPAAGSFRLRVTGLAPADARRLAELSAQDDVCANAVLAYAMLAARKATRCGPMASKALVSACASRLRAVRVVPPAVSDRVEVAVLDASVVNSPAVGARLAQHSVHGAVAVMRDSVWRVGASHIVWYTDERRGFGLREAIMRKNSSVTKSEADEWASSLIRAAAPHLAEAGVSMMLTNDVPVVDRLGGGAVGSQPGWRAHSDRRYLVLLCWDAEMMRKVCGLAEHVLSRLQIFRDRRGSGRLVCSFSYRNGRALATYIEPCPPNL